MKTILKILIAPVVFLLWLLCGLCNISLKLSAAVLGIDIKAMLKGAAFMDKLCKSKDFKKNPALVSALLQYLSMKKGKNISVMLCR